MEPLEPRLTLSADWRNLPVSIEPAGNVAHGASIVAQGADTAAYSLIGAPQERQQYGLTGKGYSVAIIDTGLDYNNPAFAGRYLGGWDFIANSADPKDDNGHGTHVAGIIASADANYPGVAPGVGIIALKALDASGTGTYGNIDLALQWVAANQAQYHIAAVNLSLGSGNYLANPFTFLDADFERLQAEGVFIAAASGNSYYAGDSGGTGAKDLTLGGKPGLAFPAVDPLVVSVGAVWAANYGAASWVNGAQDFTTAPDQIASFTQRDDKLSILAPGAYVTSTYLDNSFASLAGTSMATPFAVGAAVLVKEALDSQHKPADQASILAVMQATGASIVDAGNGQDNVTRTGLTFKRVDVLAAVASVLSPALTPNEQYVTSLYESILGREPEPAGLAFWSGLLDKGVTRAAAVDAVWNSTEHLSNLVKADYQAILGRQADPAGVAWWVAQMHSGATDTDVQRALYGSDEFYRGHGK